MFNRSRRNSFSHASCYAKQGGALLFRLPYLSKCFTVGAKEVLVIYQVELSCQYFFEIKETSSALFRPLKAN
jgi:hypothetical protein